MSEPYRHTQIGVFSIAMIVLVAALIAFVFYAAITSAEGQDATMLTLAGVVSVGACVLALAAFYALTIQIVDGKLSFWFGWGVAGKSFPIKDIRSVMIVRNPWYYFWGIKSMPGGWLYSIGPGGWAVELVFKDKRKIRLGTNKPEEIKHRLDTMMGQST